MALALFRLATAEEPGPKVPQPVAEAPQAAPEAAPFRPPDGAAVRAVLIRFEGDVVPMRRAYLFRQLDTAENDGANLVIVEIDSPGGLVDDSKLIAERLRDIDWAHTVAFVPREALSGAAIMALGCNDIVMAPGARLGDAGPIFLGEDFLFRHAPEKIRTDLVTLVRQLAEAKGRPPALAEAMVDMDTVVYEWTNEATGQQAYMSPADVEALADADEWQQGPMVRASREGLFLEVTGHEAVQLGLAQKLAANRDELKQRYGVSDELRVLKPTAVDTAVYVLNLPVVTGALFVMGLIALYFELSSPGIGFGALLSGLCFALFFWSRVLGGTAEWLELVLFAVGTMFLLVEVLIFPGFGFAGIAGILMVAVSLIMAMQGFAIPETRRQVAIFANSMTVLALSGLTFAAVAYLLRRHFGALPVFNQLLLRPPEAGERANGVAPADRSKVDTATKVHPPSIGDLGTAHTALRPAGKGRFGDRYLDVVTDSEFVKAGAAIEVVELRGTRVVVRPADRS